MTLHCHLLSHSTAEHLDQLHAGFRMLQQQGLIRLTQECRRTTLPVFPQQHLRDTSRLQLRVVLNGQLRLHYDALDSHEIHPENLAQADVYLKRSWLGSYVAALGPGHERVFPLGLNYSVLPDQADRFALARTLALDEGWQERVRGLLKALDWRNRLHFHARLRDLEALPDAACDPGVLFLVNAYDPHDRPDRSAAKVAEFAAMNETRARCIRVLRANLGPRFLGGFIPGAHARRHYPDLLADGALTRRRAYLRTVRRVPVCVATTGLHGSIGWKFAEYIALSRAVVCEPLNHGVPGGLAAGRHYLTFSTPDECALLCLRLLDNPAMRLGMMIANTRYYHASLRPDMLVLNTLLLALSVASQHPPGPPAVTAACAALR